MWVEFVVEFRFAPRVFLLILRFFLPSQKNQRSKLQFGQDRGLASEPAKAGVAFLTYLLIG